MVKCIRLQLIGYVSKSKSIGISEVLKYINNPENPGGALPKAMKMLSIDSYTGSSSNKNSDNNTSYSKYDNLNILVDYDVVIWGRMKVGDGNNDDTSKQRSNSIFNQFTKGIKSTLNSKDGKGENYESRKEIINRKFVASRLDNERLKLPFSFELCHISNTKSIPLPSSYKNAKCHIEYFLYATIHR